MTANQINYQKYLEDVRTHKVNEAIAERQARSGEVQAEASARQADVAAVNAETNRLNSTINESAVGAQWYGAQANAAYQQAMSAVSQAQQAEAVRHNQQVEKLTKYQTDVNKSAQMYKTNVDASTQKYKTDVQSDTDRYIAGLNYEVGKQQADLVMPKVEVETRASIVRELLHGGFSLAQLMK